jgi:putative DNA methylase
MSTNARVAALSCLPCGQKGNGARHQERRDGLRPTQGLRHPKSHLDGQRNQRNLKAKALSAPRKKIIEVSIPLEAINAASVREKQIKTGKPLQIHHYWARRPLTTCRAVLFAQLVDDPSSWPDRFPTQDAQDAERKRLHKLIERLVPWEASNDQAVLEAARWEIARSVAWGLGEEPPPQQDNEGVIEYLQTKAPPIYDPFSGGGSIPLEAQRLGLRAYGSDINPVAVVRRQMI